MHTGAVLAPIDQRHARLCTRSMAFVIAALLVPACTSGRSSHPVTANTTAAAGRRRIRLIVEWSRPRFTRHCLQAPATGRDQPGALHHRRGRNRDTHRPPRFDHRRGSCVATVDHSHDPKCSSRNVGRRNDRHPRHRREAPSSSRTTNSRPPPTQQLERSRPRLRESAAQQTPRPTWNSSACSVSRCIAITNS